MSSFQDRINRMNASKDKQRREDEEFVEKQKVRIFINDCDEIRSELRRHLLNDSKYCQLEQMKEQQKRQQTMRDLEMVWHDVQTSNSKQRTERELFIDDCRRREGISIQYFQKDQMVEKVKRECSEVNKEIDEERKILEQISKDEYIIDQRRIAEEKVDRKFMKEAISRQMQDNYQKRKEKLERELKMDEMKNHETKLELERKLAVEKNEREEFKYGVFCFLEHLATTRQHHQNVEREKEKLIEEINAKALENEWLQRREFNHKRAVVNQTARLGQVAQIKSQELQQIQEISKEKEENKVFNEREIFERQKIKEAQWQQRLKAFHYGQELLEQKKAEHLRDLAEKQKLDESLKLATRERERREIIGHEFVKSWQDVLPLHPNLLIIQKGKHN